MLSVLGKISQITCPALAGREGYPPWLLVVVALSTLTLGAAEAEGQSRSAAREPALETAALPPGFLAGRHDTDLPQPLSLGDAALYRRIFAHQDRADWAAADRDIARLRDKRLLGHVLADRYRHPRYRTSFHELHHWLGLYADLPDAVQMHKLAEARRPKGDKTVLNRPAAESAGPPWLGDETIIPTEAPPLNRKNGGTDSWLTANVKASVRATLRSGDLAGAESLLHGRDAAALLSAADFDQLRAQIAAGHFAAGSDDQAYRLANSSVERSGGAVTRASWIAGLAAWRQDRLEGARKHFEALATTPNASSWEVASGAFWAARVHMRQNRMAKFNEWMERAAEHPRTFYGLLARHVLGLPSGFNWGTPPLSTVELNALMRSPGAQRALSLVQIGESERAEAELRRLYGTNGLGLNRVLLAIALRANMPGLALRLGRELAEIEGHRHDAAFYPIPRWTPKGGYTVDRALIFAFMRQESAFNPWAESPAGAKGLMQLMPQTAAAMDDRGLRTVSDIFDPEVNVTLGQRYIKHLLDHEIVGSDLIRLAAAYNGGPGNLSKWKRDQDSRGQSRDDALVFIESLPSPETRHFITRVLFNYWIYSERLGLPLPSLVKLAEGDWPTYIELDTGAGRSVRNAQAR